MVVEIVPKTAAWKEQPRGRIEINRFHGAGCRSEKNKAAERIGNRSDEYARRKCGSILNHFNPNGLLVVTLARRILPGTANETQCTYLT